MLWIELSELRHWTGFQIVQWYWMFKLTTEREAITTHTCRCLEFSQREVSIIAASQRRELSNCLPVVAVVVGSLYCLFWFNVKASYPCWSFQSSFLLDRSVSLLMYWRRDCVFWDVADTHSPLSRHPPWADTFSPQQDGSLQRTFVVASYWNATLS